MSGQSIARRRRKREMLNFGEKSRGEAETER
jgi:hypothetical protein